MKNAHTPGPWHSRPAIRVNEFIVTAESGGFAPLARVKGDKRTTMPAAMANARLMAAAPDLFDALLAMLEACPDREKNDSTVHAVELALNAIGKAVSL